MSVSRTRYVASLIEDNLGLSRGSLPEERVPQALVQEVADRLSGGAVATSEPDIEKRFLSLLEDVEMEELDANGFFVRKMRWPDGLPFAVCLTHDVDNISRPLRHVLKTRGRFTTGDLVGQLLGLESLYNNIEEIAKREGESGFRSSFYFLTSNYPLKSMAPTLRRLREGGWDIGLHGDFGTHDSVERMKGSIERFSSSLGFHPRGVREHYLKFAFGVTWELMEKAGFDYDTTVGLSDELGFRLGLATPFHPPDAGWNAMKLLEIPLTLMDTTLWGYLKRSEQEGMEDIMSVLSKVREVGGLFTLLWHQEAVKMRGGRLYWRLLDEFKRGRCFVGSASEIANWWAQRSLPMVRDGNTISIEGSRRRDLILHIKTLGRKDVHVEGGSLLSSKDGYTARVEASTFRVRVS